MSSKAKIKRKSLYNKQKGICAYCDNHTPETEATIEHLTPKSRGGTISTQNTVMACKKCNFLIKDFISLEELFDYVRQVVPLLIKKQNIILYGKNNNKEI